MQDARAGLRKEVVEMPMMAAVELDNDLFFCKAAREADGAHRRLGSRIDETDKVHRRDTVADVPGHVDLFARCRSEAHALLNGFLRTQDHVAVSVAEDQ